MKNEGKRFERDFIESIPESWYTHRFHDSAGTWQGGTTARFTPSNVCDFMIFYNSQLWLLELKSHKGSSLPLTCIRQKQLDGLLLAEHKSVKAGFVINFRDFNETYYVPAFKVQQFIEREIRKSIPISWIRENAITIEQWVKPRGTRQVYSFSIFE
jgi:recombination protein U